MLKKQIYVTVIGIFLFSILSIPVYAHCPLCTIGAGAAAAGAVWLGIKKVVVALFIGAFAISMGLWLGKKVKKSRLLKAAVISVIFITTLIALDPITAQIYPIYLSLSGDYGSILNRTYLINPSLLSSFLGGVVVYVMPTISSKITKLREGKMLPFQGIILTFVSLIVLGGIIQII